MNLEKHKGFIKQVLKTSNYTKELYFYIKINRIKGSRDNICFINGLLRYDHMFSFYILDSRCDGCICCEGNYCNLMKALK